MRNRKGFTSLCRPLEAALEPVQLPYQLSEISLLPIRIPADFNNDFKVRKLGNVEMLAVNGRKRVPKLRAERKNCWKENYGIKLIYL